MTRDMLEVSDRYKLVARDCHAAAEHFREAAIALQERRPKRAELPLGLALEKVEGIVAELAAIGEDVQ